MSEENKETPAPPAAEPQLQPEQQRKPDPKPDPKPEIKPDPKPQPKAEPPPASKPKSPALPRDWSKVRLPTFTEASAKSPREMTDADRYALLKDLAESLENLKSSVPSYFKKKLDSRVEACRRLMQTI